MELLLVELQTFVFPNMTLHLLDGDGSLTELTTEEVKLRIYYKVKGLKVRVADQTPALFRRRRRIMVAPYGCWRIGLPRYVGSSPERAV